MTQDGEEVESSIVAEGRMFVYEADLNESGDDDNGMSKQEITIVTGMKSHSIDEYLKIIKELNA